MTEAVELTTKEAFAHVRTCVNEPGVHLEDSRTLSSAQCVWNSMGEHQHQCYWNDRFAAAIMCGMDEHAQRVAAWAAVSNGLIGYWEWMSHAGFDMVAVLKHLGIVPPEYDPGMENRGRYVPLPDELCKALIEKFKLPTYCLCKGRADLTEEELADLRELDSHYPKFSPLTNYVVH